jgi:type I restriction enzyme S subunit
MPEKHKGSVSKRTIRLGDFCEKIGSGATPRGGKETYSETGPVALIRSQNVYNEGFTFDGLARISCDQAKELQNVEVKKGDVLLNITGDSVARSCQVHPEAMPARVNQHVAIIRPVKTKLDARYLRFYLTTKSMQSEMRALSSAGATRNALTKSMIENFRVPELDIEDQKSIASVLGALEDKISICREITETSMSIASLIFKDWFIDFGPTRAKMTGRAPYLAPAAWSLFPDNLDDTGIPLGWNLVPFESLLDSSLGGDWGDEEAGAENSEAVYVIRGTDLRDISKGGIGKVPLRYTSPKKRDARKLQDMDIVIEVSGGSPTQPTGRSLLITSSILERFDSPAVCASFCRRFRPSSKSNAIYAALHLSVLYESGGTWEYQNQSTGISNFQTTNFLKSELVVQPGIPVLDAFTEIVEPLFRRSSSNEVAFLSDLRDEILPKLMSGELQVKEAETIVRKTV